MSWDYFSLGEGRKDFPKVETGGHIIITVVFTQQPLMIFRGVEITRPPKKYPIF
jgi:hypothetical protein